MSSDIVDRALRTYEFTREMDVSQLAYSREEPGEYLRNVVRWIRGEDV